MTKTLCPSLIVACVFALCAVMSAEARSITGVSTSGTKTLTGNLSLAEGAPKWVRGLSVNGDGNIVIDVKPMGVMVIVM